MHFIRFLMLATKPEWKSGLKRPKYYVNRDTQTSACCKLAEIYCNRWRSLSIFGWNSYVMEGEKGDGNTDWESSRSWA